MPFNTSTNRDMPRKENKTTYAMPNGEQITLTPQTVRQYLVRGNGTLTDQEVMMFLALCKSQKLNPFVNDAYLIKYGDKSPAQIVVGKGALEKRAELNPQYDGKEAGIVIATESGLEYRMGALLRPTEELVGGWCNVYRKDRKLPERVEVSFGEYIGRKSNGEVNSQWATKPATMIQKVAVSQALRAAFPNDLNQMYGQEEMDSSIPEPITMQPYAEIQQPEPAAISAPNMVREMQQPVQPQAMARELDAADLL